MQKVININSQVFQYTVWAKIIRNLLFGKKKLVLEFCNMQLENQGSSYKWLQLDLNPEPLSL